LEEINQLKKINEKLENDYQERLNMSQVIQTERDQLEEDHTLFKKNADLLYTQLEIELKELQNYRNESIAEHDRLKQQTIMAQDTIEKINHTLNEQTSKLIQETHNNEVLLTKYIALQQSSKETAQSFQNIQNDIDGRYKGEIQKLTRFT
jgi:uncharacterized protein YgiM (DUF1202 family)